MSWELKDHKMPRKKDDTENVRTLVNLIPDSAQGNLGLVLGSGVDLSRTNFKFEESRIQAQDEDSVQIVRFSHQLQNGGSVEKTYRIYSNSYSIEMDVRIFSSDAQVGDVSAYFLDLHGEVDSAGSEDEILKAV